MTSASAAITSQSYRCRYLLIAGCKDSFGTSAKRKDHEREVHSAILVELRRCPMPGCVREPPFNNGEQGRAIHLSNSHGIGADSPERFRLDSEQVEAMYNARYPDGPPEARVYEFTGMPAVNGSAATEAVTEGDPVTGAAQGQEPAATEAVTEAEPEREETPDRLDQLAALIAEARQEREHHAKRMHDLGEQIAYVASHISI